eukprot:COSAG06_NODE_4138_length_4534_cov_1.863811_1_plen_204_part_10
MIVQLSALTEISLWNCGLTGTIDPTSLCALSNLHILALSDNELRGTLPECMTTLAIEWLWLAGNNFHGPLVELSRLGQFLKDIPSRRLEDNRWAPLLPTDKEALLRLTSALGIGHGERNWDFGFSYEWSGHVDDDSHRVTAERDVSFRHWKSGMVPESATLVKFSAAFPWKGRLMTHVAANLYGGFSVGAHIDSEPRSVVATPI